MKNRVKVNPFPRIFVFLFILIVMIVITAIGLYYYAFSIPEPEGLSLTDWPANYTDDFSFWFKTEDETITVEKNGLDRLDEYGLWLQIIDENGNEVFAHNKPKRYPASYSASELLMMSASGYEHGYTVFVSVSQDSAYSYLIGFPYNIGKYSLYYNGERLQRLYPAAGVIVIAAFAALVSFGMGYGVWLSRRMSKITNGIEAISSRDYRPLKENGTFSEIHGALNKMDAEIRSGDKLREETERTRKEWIANITHDLKTPLSPIKGYAELLADASETQNAREYGTIILKNAVHAEKLINDLKLIYQLEAGVIPFSPQRVRLARCLKEWVIDIVNDPAFSKRDVWFECNVSDSDVFIDPDLFRRAVQNLVINALVHSPPETEVRISAEADSHNAVHIHIRDNGAGMTEEEQARLFERYYRGTGTEERPEGSGLGLAVAKQIVTLHGGEITVRSEPNEGTEFIILIPPRN